MGFEGGSQPSAANGKVEVLDKLMREGPDEKLDLWLEILHFQISPSKVFLADQGMYLRAKLRHSFAPFSMYQ